MASVASSRGLRPGAAIAAAAGVLGALVAPVVIAAVSAAGSRIATSDVVGDYVKGVLWAAALGATIPFWPVPRDERRVLGALWALKCVVALGFMLLYEWYYPALDSRGYFESATTMTQPLDWSVLQSAGGTQIIVALVRLHSDLLVSSYHAAKITWAMLGFIAVYLFYRAACVATGERHTRVLVALMCFPSIMFWSSILGKDPLVLLGIALVTYGITAWLHSGNPVRAWPALVGLPIAVAVRLWLGPILLAPLVIVAMAAVRGWGRRLVMFVVASAVLAALIAPLKQRLAISALSDTLEVVQSSSQLWAEGGSAQRLTTNLANPVELIAFIPRGMAAALIRPLPGEILNPFGMLAGLENLVVVWLIVLAAIRAKRRDLADPVIMWAIGFVLLWGVVYGPISYQNLGTASRFRLQVLPVMLLVSGRLALDRKSIQRSTDQRSADNAS